MGNLEQLKFLIDAEPKDVLRGSKSAPTGRLSGWAFHPSAPLSFELRLDGSCISRFAPSLPRHDVYKAFPNAPFSLLSGFSIEFPFDLLRDITADRVQLFACLGSEEKCLWSWTAALRPQDDIHNLTELTRFFTERRGLSKFERQLLEKKDALLTVVIHSDGNASALLAQVGRVLEGFQAGDLGRLTVSVLFNETPSPALMPLLVSRFPELGDNLQSFSSASEVFDSLSTESDNQLLLFLDAQVSTQYLDFSALLEDFLSIPNVSVLMPTVFGGERGVRQPRKGQMADLSSYRKNSRMFGEDVPALFAVNSLMPVWLSSAKFLGSMDKEFAIGALSGKGAAQIVIDGQYYVDLRQVIQCWDQSSVSLSEVERGQMQFIVDSEIEHISNEAEASKPETFVFLVSKESTERSATNVLARSISSFARKVREQGYAVDFVFEGDSSDLTDSFFEGFPLHSFTDYAETAKEQNRKSWLIATSWDLVKAANLLRYLMPDAEVLSYVHEDSVQRFTEFELENLDTARYAEKGALLNLATNAWVSDLLTAKDKAVLPLRIPLDSQQFFQHPTERLENSVLCVVDPSCANYQGKILEVLKSLKLANSLSTASLVGGKHSGKLSPETISLVENISNTASVEELAELYSKHEVVLDLSLRGPLSQHAEEVLACGASPVWVDPMLSVEELSEAISKLFADSSARKKYNTGLSKQFEGSVGQSFDNLSETLDARVREVQATLEQQRSKRQGLSIVIPIYNALDATCQCIRSVLKYAPEDCEVILVDDCSDFSVREALRDISQTDSRISLIAKEKNGGFIHSCLSGFAAAHPENDLLLINSDLVVSENSFTAIREAAYSRYNAGVASSLSTNSPNLKIDINYGDSLETASKTISEIYTPKHPTVITPEGQFIYFRRWALEEFGFFDPVYNRGFCEETDLCMRMFLHGVDLVLADNTLVFHRKSESFGEEGGLAYKIENRPIFDARYAKYYWLAYREFVRRAPLAEVRNAYRAKKELLEPPLHQLPVRDLPEYLTKLSSAASFSRSGKLNSNLLNNVDVAILVPSVIMGGGTLSVLQHANEMMLRGIEARVFSLLPPDPIPFPHLAPPIPISPAQLLELNWDKQKVIATFWLTAYFVRALKHRHPGIDPYYYIQDYEPWFYSQPESLPTIQEAEASYDLGLRGVAKTEYLRGLLKEKHNQEIDVICPGVARTIFYPGQQDAHMARPRLTAYYRPRTPRRGGKEALEVLREVKRRVPEADLRLFGEDVELSEEDAKVVTSLGKMSQADVAKLYRDSDIVLDLSYWHGFGRMGVESMASGVVPVLSDSGGIRRYAVDKENSFIVSHEDLSETVERIVQLMKNRELRLQMRANGLKTVERFSEAAAVNDWLEIFGMRTPQAAHPLHHLLGDSASVEESVSRSRKISNLT